MPETILHAQRTRSQLTLPDNILQLSQRSPWKDARTALRASNSNPPELRMDVCVENAEEADDELLLTSRKRTSLAAKRSASPPPGDEYTSCSDSPSGGREHKRLKRDTSVGTHSRSLSQPNFRLMEPSIEFTPAGDTVKKPASSHSSYKPPVALAVGSKGRAQSVPLFANVRSVPHLDLRKPPSSPQRSRSRSPHKEREQKMRITSAHSVFPEGREVSSKTEESVPGAQVDIVPRQAPGTLTPAQTADTQISTSDPVAPEHNPISNTLAPNIAEPPSTPATTHRLFFNFPLSPLTPLPETPRQINPLANTEGESTRLGWGVDTDEERDGLISIGDASQGVSDRPLPFDPNHVPKAMGEPTAHSAPKQSLQKSLTRVSTLTKEETSKQPQGVPENAFTFLMARARTTKGSDEPKGKAKQRIMSKKVIPSSASSSKSFQKQTSDPKGYGPDNGKDDQPRISLKAKMRPKQVPKAKPVTGRLVPVPVPVPIPSVVGGGFMETRATSSQGYPTPAALDSQSTSVTLLGGVEARATTKPYQSQAQSVLQDGAKDITPILSEPQPVTESLVPPKADVSTGVDNEVSTKSQPASNPPSTAIISKLPRPKRAPTTSIIVGRVTRSVSSKIIGTDAGKSSQAASKPTARRQNPTAKKVPLQVNKGRSTPPPKAPHDSGASTSSLSDVPSDAFSDNNAIHPGSPMKLSSPRKRNAASSPSEILPRTPSKAKFTSKSESPSPTKMTRSASMFSVRKTDALTRTFTGYSNPSNKSSLSTLANALEKLRMPPPARPNTSMGFSRDVNTKMDDAIEPTRESLGDGPAISRTEHKAADVRVSGIAGSSKASQQPRPGFFGRSLPSGASVKQSGSGPVMRGPGLGNPPAGRPRMFGVGNGFLRGAGRSGVFQKASRKTSLPSVMASPVKGSNVMDSTASLVDSSVDESDSCNASATGEAPDRIPASVEPPPNSGKGKGKERFMNASRRASLASQALSQSLSSLPLSSTDAPKMMGPPSTPIESGTRSTTKYPSSGLPSSAGEVINGAPSNIRRTMSLRSAPSALGKIKGITGEHVSGQKMIDDAELSKNVPESLKILIDCVIFVDVRTDDGDEAGSLFIEMLEGVGAKILTRVGQTCTHIVYKNGLPSTSTRYRLLRDPKPFVVGIAWVVECVEQRRRVDESKFVIDLDSVNVAGNHKRRRSMLPKHIAPEDSDRNSPEIERDRETREADVSMDGSSSSVTLDDGLTPLEKARRRKVALRTP